MNDASAFSLPLMRALKREGLDTVQGAFAYGGGEELDKAGLARRRRTRLRITDETGRTHQLYLKRYGRESLIGRLRRRWTYGPRRSPAGVEFENIRAVGAAGVPTMGPILFGEEFDRLGARRSYLIVTAVPGEALERCMDDFLRREGLGEATACLSEALAAMIRTFHAAGHVHRDLYSSHVFLNEQGGAQSLYLIDLARRFSPRRRQFRWRVKDLAQLKYSMPPRWVRAFWDEFLGQYARGFDAALLGRYNRAIDWRVEAMRRRSRRKRADPRSGE